MSDALHRAQKLSYTVFENPDRPKTVAAFLAAGSTVVVVSGRSEFGPRALGPRSILADPRRPIVETMDGAVRAFAEMPITVMVLGRFMLVKKLSPQLTEIGVLPQTYAIPTTTVVQDGTRWDLPAPGRLAREVIACVQRRTGAVVFVRHDFPLYGPYLEWLRQGRKRTTIRFRKRAVEVPRQAELPLFETADYGVGDRHSPAARVRVNSIRYQRFGELTAEDAVRDGFDSLEHMLDHFRRIYPRLEDGDWITLYRIELVDDYIPGGDGREEEAPGGL